MVLMKVDLLFTNLMDAGRFCCLFRLEMVLFFERVPAPYPSLLFFLVQVSRLSLRVHKGGRRSSSRIDAGTQRSNATEEEPPQVQPPYPPGVDERM